MPYYPLYKILPTGYKLFVDANLHLIIMQTYILYYAIWKKLCRLALYHEV